MFKDRLKNMIGSAAPAAGPSSPAAPPAGSMKPSTRQSHGLEQFCSVIRERPGLSILDFGAASQANVTFLTEMGHKLASEDYVRSLELAFGGGDFYENQADPQRAAAFLSENLNFPPESFDGALVWDSFQFLSPNLLQPTVERLYEILRPKACVLAFFHSDEKSDTVPLYQYRIGDQRNLLLSPRGVRKRAQFFNNRGLEKLFQRFDSIKFFLTRDNLREVIVRR